MQFLSIVVFQNEVKIWLLALLVFLLAFFLLKLLKKIATEKIGSFSHKTSTRVDDFILNFVKATRSFFIFSWSLYCAYLLLGFHGTVDAAASKVIFLVTMLQAGIWGNAAVRCAVESYLKSRTPEDTATTTAIGLTTFVARVCLYGMLALLTLNNLGFNVTALITGLGVGGIAVALAVQNILSDLFASLTIVLDKPFVVGDFIIVGEHKGTVEKVGLKTTRIRSLSGEQLIFPNASLLQSQLRNFKTMTERRVAFTVGLVYQTSFQKLKIVPQLIKEIIEKQEKVRFDRSHFSNYGSFSLDFETVYWITDADYNVFMDIQQQIYLQIFERFEKEGLSFAYPTQTLFGKNETIVTTVQNVGVSSSQIAVE